MFVLWTLSLCMFSRGSLSQKCGVFHICLLSLTYFWKYFCAPWCLSQLGVGFVSLKLVNSCNNGPWVRWSWVLYGHQLRIFLSNKIGSFYYEVAKSLGRHLEILPILMTLSGSWDCGAKKGSCGTPPFWIFLTVGHLEDWGTILFFGNYPFQF